MMTMMIVGAAFAAAVGGGAGANRQTEPGFPRPNGMRVIGYADSSDIIQRFVEDLKEAERTQANRETLRVKNVHFTEASVARVDRSVLMQAPTTSQRGFGRSAAPVNPETGVYSFEVNIEFDGPFYEAAPAPTVVQTPVRRAPQGRSGSAGRYDDD